MPARPYCIKTLRKDKITGEWYLPAVRSKDMAKRKPKHLKNGQFAKRKVEEKLPDYSTCLNCKRKKKEPKWKMTHFCSLKCFVNYRKKWKPQIVTWENVNDNRAREVFIREEGLVLD